jgi:aspartate racemase
MLDGRLEGSRGGVVKAVGIIGGIGPESTIEYYRFLIAEYRSRLQDGSYPPILINSIDMTRMLRLIDGGELDATTEFLAGEVLKLEKAGADLAVLASNTPHLVFDAIARQSAIPMISIVEATCEVALDLGLERVGLFGTRFTMQGRFYPEVFSGHGIAVVLPGPEDQAYIHEKYMGELVNGLIVPETRERLLGIAERLREEQQLQGIILGGTELPLILRDAQISGVPFLDTTKIHVEKIVAEMLL